jgi:hypothetical protein
MLPPGSEAAIELLPHLQLGQRRAVGGHRIVGQAERERGKVLLRVAGPKVGRGPFALALIAASTSVLERPGAVGTLGYWPVRYSAVVSHHRHPSREL